MHIIPKGCGAHNAENFSPNRRCMAKEIPRQRAGDAPLGKMTPSGFKALGADSRPAAYSPKVTLKNWLCAPVGGVTSIVVITALFFPFTSTPLAIGEAESSPATVSAA